MHDRTFDLEDLSRSRFAVSPVWELVTSLRILGSGRAGHVHGPWLRSTRDAVQRGAVDVSRLLVLVPPTGHIADFLTPAPTERAASFETELDRIADTRPTTVARDLAALRPVTAPGRATLAEARRDPATFLRRVTHDLQNYWAVAMAGHWPRLRGLAEADIAWRLEQIADRGTRAALSTLHPRVRVDGDRVVVRATCTAPEPASRGQGLVLVPCAFAWPEILLLDTPTQRATLAYAPRGIAALWWEDAVDDTAVSGLIGRTRADLLHLLDLPATNVQLAAQLRLTPPTTNAHLQILQRAGAVSRRRRGRSVFYARTELGERLLQG
jgi:DNA-binding transcriptional ArsR family regulator